MRRAAVILGWVAVAGGLAAGPGVARADGAFPDGQNVLLPADLPSRIVVATNFGLVTSDDDGAHWQYSCESQATSNGRLYSQGPGPEHRMFSLSDFGAAVTKDLGCTWTIGGGPFDGGLVLDVFPDPIDAARVLVIAEPPGLGGRMPAALYESRDGGASYGAAIYSTPPDVHITGVEVARSDPRVVYLTAFLLAPTDTLPHPRLVRSADAGANWEPIDLEPALGPSRVALAAVDPTDADRLYLRVSGTNQQMRSVDSIAVSSDGGLSFAMPVSLTGGTLTAFLARQNGTVLATGLLGATVVGYRSVDRGASFDSWRPALHPRGFGERGDTLFVVANDGSDGFALGSSEDNGDSWTPRMRYADIEGVQACAYQACLLDCQRQMAIGLFAPSVCASDAGGAGGGSGNTFGGGGCSIAGSTSGGALAGLMLALMLLRSASRSRSRRARRRARAVRAMVLAAGVAAMVPGSALGYVQSRSTDGAPATWRESCIPVEVHLSGLPGVSDDQMRAAVTNAARVWTSAANPCTSLSIALSFAGDPGPAPANDGLNVIGARTDGWCQGAPAPVAGDAEAPACNQPSAAAATSIFTLTGGRIAGGDTELNLLTFAWGALDDLGQPAERQDLQATLTHEIGHLIGLEHPCWSGLGPRAVDDVGQPVPDCYGAAPAIQQDTMFPTVDAGDISKRMLSPDARRAVCALYPLRAGAPAPTGVPETCAAGKPGGCGTSPAGSAPVWPLLAFAALIVAARRPGRSAWRRPARWPLPATCRRRARRTRRRAGSR